SVAGEQCPLISRQPVHACDGAIDPVESGRRPLPCFALSDDGKTCTAGVRPCADEGGVAYARGCRPSGAASWVLPDPRCGNRFAEGVKQVCADRAAYRVEKLDTAQRMPLPVCGNPGGTLIVNARFAALPWGFDSETLAGAVHFLADGKPTVAELSV